MSKSFDAFVEVALHDMFDQLADFAYDCEYTARDVAEVLAVSLGDGLAGEWRQWAEENFEGAA